MPEAKRIDQKPSKRNIKLTLQELHKLPTPSVQGMLYEMYHVKVTV